MITPVIFEEVKILLTVTGEHADDIARIDAVSEELYAHTRSHVRCARTSWLAWGKADESSISTFEEACVGMVTEIIPCDFTNVSNGVENFIAASFCSVTIEFVTNSRPWLPLRFKPLFADMPVASCVILSDFIP